MPRRNIHQRLHCFPWYDRCFRKLKVIRINQRRTNLYQALHVFSKNIWEHRLIGKANGVAFSFTLAIFPSVIFIFTLIPYIHWVLPQIDADSILAFVSKVMPREMYLAAADTIHDIINKERQRLLSFGAFLALFLATNGMHGLMSAFNSIYKTDEKRGYFKTRLIATGLTLLLSSVLLFSIFLMIVGKLFLNYLSTVDLITTQTYIIYLVTFLEYGIIIMSFFIATSIIYYFAPAIHDRWHFFSAGAVFAAFACVASSYAFSYYINHFANYNKFYGSLGMLIALMFWLHLLSLILLVGFEYNASVDRAIVSGKINKTTSIFE